MPGAAARRRLLLVPCVAAGLALGAAGCGTETPSEEPAAAPTTIKAGKDLLITQEDIRQAGPDSAGGTLLRWWQALQYSDVETAADLYVTPPSLAELKGQIIKLRAILAATRLEIQEQEERAGQARILVVLRAAHFGQNRTAVSDTPASFRLERVGQDWRLPDNEWLEQRYAAQLEAERNARRRPRATRTASPRG